MHFDLTCPAVLDLTGEGAAGEQAAVRVGEHACGQSHPAVAACP